MFCSCPVEETARSRRCAEVAVSQLDPHIRRTRWTASHTQILAILLEAGCIARWDETLICLVRQVADIVPFCSRERSYDDTTRDDRRHVAAVGAELLRLAASRVEPTFRAQFWEAVRTTKVVPSLVRAIGNERGLSAPAGACPGGGRQGGVGNIVSNTSLLQTRVDGRIPCCPLTGGPLHAPNSGSPGEWVSCVVVVAVVMVVMVVVVVACMTWFDVLFAVCWTGMG